MPEWVGYVLLALAPLVAAAFSGPGLTALVAGGSAVIAVVLTAVTLGRSFGDAIPSLFVVFVAGGVAIIVSRWRTTRHRSARKPGAETVSTPAGGPEAGVSPVTGLPDAQAALQRTATMDGTWPRLAALLAVEGLPSIAATHGGAIADEVMFAVGGRTSYSLGSGDLVAHWDDATFVAVLCGDPAAGRALLESVQRKVNDNPIRTAAGPLPVTVRITEREWREGADLTEVLAPNN